MSATAFTIIDNTQAGNFTKDGAYVEIQTPQPNLPAGPATGLIVIVGAGSRGELNVLLPFTDNVSGALAIGMDTELNKSALREALSAMPEGKQFAAIRVSDGTDVEATLDFMDSQESPSIVLEGTAVCTGTDLNQATGRIDLQSGTLTVSPVFQVTIFSPGRNPLVYSNIVGYATSGGAYDAPTFKANALAALNGTAPNTAPNPDFVFTGGSSTSAPAVATVFTATGGTNGDSGVSDETLIGENDDVGTGMYVATNQIAGAQLALAAFDTPSLFAAVSAFTFAQGAFGWETFPAGTDTGTAVSSKTTNGMSSDNMGVVMDWDEVFDTYQQAYLLVSPIGKAAGIVASLPAYQYPGNNPGAYPGSNPSGAQGVITTERMELGAMGNGEAGQRQTNGILYLGITPNGVLGLPHGLTSSGQQINTIRMRNYIANGVGQIMGRFISGMLETSLPIAQADENDPRIQCETALNQWLASLTTPGAMQISASQVVLNDTNNTQTTISEGFLIAQIFVTTLTGVQFALAVVQVGNTVQIQTSSIAAAA